MTSISKEHKRQIEQNNLPEIKKTKGFMREEWLNSTLEKAEETMDPNYQKEPLEVLKKY